MKSKTLFFTVTFVFLLPIISQASIISCNNFAFDPRGYLEKNPDVAAAKADPCQHFMKYGQFEGRAALPFGIIYSEQVKQLLDPKITNCGGKAFDGHSYLEVYTDVKAAGVDPCLHFNKFGFKEGRSPLPLGAKMRSSNPPGNQGGGQGPGSVLSKCSGIDFDAAGYLTAYPDVKAAGVDACTHFTLFGRSEGRDPNPFDLDGGSSGGPSSGGGQGPNSGSSLTKCSGIDFDGPGYLTAYPDVKVAGVDPCTHFTLFGRSEGRDPNPFDLGGPSSGGNQGRDFSGPEKYELIMNLTGFGYDPLKPEGIHDEWMKMIKSTKYSWGYGITGIRLGVRWYEWEPKEGEFTRQGIRKVIEFCRREGLSLSVFFWPWRIDGDGFIPTNHLMQGHNGKFHYYENNKRMGSLASNLVNQKIARSVKELTKEILKYEGAYYMAIGTGDTEELHNPVVGAGQSEISQRGISGFEGIMQEDFRKMRQSKNRVYQRPTVLMGPNGPYLKMSDDVGKDFARLISQKIESYFNNFASAVRSVDTTRRLRVVYYYPDAGSPQNATFLHANFGRQANKADAMYGTDGSLDWDTDRKLLVNAINLGLGKISITEFDPHDLGKTYFSPEGCLGGINFGKFEFELMRNYGAGVNVVSLAQTFCPSELRGLEVQFRNLRNKYVGKVYQRPSKDTTVVPISQGFWGGTDIYMSKWNGVNFLRPDESSFWND